MSLRKYPPVFVQEAVSSFTRRDRDSDEFDLALRAVVRDLKREPDAAVIVCLPGCRKPRHMCTCRMVLQPFVLNERN